MDRLIIEEQEQKKAHGSYDYVLINDNIGQTTKNIVDQLLKDKFEL